MTTHELCCIGHITLDKIVTPRSIIHMPGGTSFYFSHAIRRFDDIDYALVTALGESEMSVVEELRNYQIEVSVMPSKKSVYFENIYGENQDNRKQRVLAKADPFSVDFLTQINAKIFHLGSLLADDFSTDVIRYLSGKGLVSVDSQGYLREVRDKKVYAVDWPGKMEALKYIHFLKVNEHEMEVLTGSADVKTAAFQLYEWGVQEVLITLGSMGSVIYDGKTFYKIPAFKPKEVVDATGCGDTYMTGYLYCRAKGKSIEEAGRFAAAMSTLKIEASGPFKGSKEDIFRCMETQKELFPEI
ncbi:MAG: PfkB family carbohydrate kinase [Massilibacteroides sp.]|nr:PfkB family carbohydrate kinase [Massilibacteroides sp.]MDD3063006.1 PfkB family carbohydrate kinase [Massilibacteroides sp.]MDD4114952.1 PfkB family carbohydrate kinase [Massilibacteroides sp.]MDD4661420.1 PfkB family carbohydrate kinase [Massilibacteroides sp.]